MEGWNKFIKHELLYNKVGKSVNVVTSSSTNIIVHKVHSFLEFLQCIIEPLRITKTRITESTRYFGILLINILSFASFVSVTISVKYGWMQVLKEISETMLTLDINMYGHSWWGQLVVIVCNIWGKFRAVKTLVVRCIMWEIYG